MKTVPIETETEFRKLVNRWIPPSNWDNPVVSFRGQRNANWKLESTLERAARQKFGDLFRQRLPAFEVAIIDQFIKHCIKFELGDIHPGGKLPEQSDTWDWLSLLQHYGHPTRLIDFTDDLWTAIFFALSPPDLQIPFSIYELPLNSDNKLPTDANGKVYRVSSDHNKINTHELLALVLKYAGCERIKTFPSYNATTLPNEWRNPKQNYGWDTPAKPKSPGQLNSRLTRQRGRFLYQLWPDDQLEQMPELIKYEIAAKLRPVAMQMLQDKGNNYTKEYLFPNFEPTS